MSAKDDTTTIFGRHKDENRNSRGRPSREAYQQMMSGKAWFCVMFAMNETQFRLSVTR